MKKKIGPLILFALLILFVPALALLAGALPNTSGGPGGQVYEGGDMILLDAATGQTITVTEREYVIGALVCEMPALYETEALKAQAVAIHTYALHLKETQTANPNPDLKGAYFKVNSANYSGYVSRTGAQKLYGNQFDEYYTKMEQAVDATLKYILIYDGGPISACFFAISPGKTENSENVFSTALPYLVSVDSSFDQNAEGYLSEKKVTPEQFEELMIIYDSQFIAQGDPETWAGTSRLSDAGTVMTQTICGRQYAGTSLRQIFDLRSAAFTLSYDGQDFVFKVKGYGHDVGMSQYGANYLAGQGKTYVEILNYYYTGAILRQV